jgi:hypothetical protein
VIPLYAFVRGDSLGLVVIVEARHTIRDVAEIVQRAASIRVAPVAAAEVRRAGACLDPELTVEAAGLQALDRIDVGVFEGGQK